MSGGETCGICGGAARFAFSARIFCRHDARYFFCPACEFLRTPNPGWLKDAYSEAISRADTGLVQRNVELSAKMACVLDACFSRSGRFLDTAGGTGLMTRLMRDIGFEFLWEDPYCVNALAPGFEAEPGSGGYEAVSAFEVLEHVTDPLAYVRELTQRSTTGTLIFTTELFAGAPPGPDWWYYMFDTGQHISFFTLRTLGEIARRLDLSLHSARGLHLLTRKKISPLMYRWALRRAKGGVPRSLRKRMQSLTGPDQEFVLKKLRGT